jgi:hypothetical protein
VFLLFSCSLYARKDSSLYCAQYLKAINHIKHDSSLTHEHSLKQYRFNMDQHLKAGGSIGYFLPEYFSYVYKKPYDAIDKKIVDSTYSLFSKNNSDSTYTISCLHSDRKPFFNLKVIRENDTIICIIVARFEKQRHGLFHKKTLGTSADPTFGLAYLFIFDNKNNIDVVFKSLFI